MKLEAVTIFPEYFDSLKLSLLGKAQAAGLIEITIHDLRTYADGNHKSVDDTPYGGGAGMVMKPEVWGAALDPILTAESELIILTPAGKKFNQLMAQELSTAEQIVFACGRYEGIDARVTDYYRAQGVSVREVSIGDYVLGGGEVAAMVMIEAITRLIPGVLGNPESLTEESHNEDGFLEYPNYTKPASWRGIEVPEVLLSGNHGEIAKWRATQAKTRAQEHQ